jgi:flagellar biosynthesis/type III secretory pathway protein FliH
MTSFEAKRPSGWKTDTLLAKAGNAPAFLRMPWDNAQASDFGPWRVIANDAPLVATSTESALDTDLDLLPSADDADIAEDDSSPNLHAPLIPAGPSAEEIEAMKAAAYAEGLAAGKLAGKQEAEETVAQEQAKDHALLSSVVAALQRLGADQERLFEPMNRLAVHLAEQLVRSELQLSGAAIEQLVKQALAHFDQPTDKAIVHLHPQDLERFSRYGESARGLRLEPDARLQPGSVRVQVNDTLVEDLIENRLEVLARQLLGDAHALVNSNSLDVVVSDDDTQEANA